MFELDQTILLAHARNEDSDDGLVSDVDEDDDAVGDDDDEELESVDDEEEEEPAQ